MYLSKLTQSINSTSKNMLLLTRTQGEYAMHQMLWTLFEGDESRSHLFRIEESRSGLIVYLLSKTKPKQQHPGFQIETKAFSPKLEQGSNLGFSLRLNPTVYRDGKRHDVVMDAKRQHGTTQDMDEIVQSSVRSWLSKNDRLMSWGIELNSLPIVSDYTQHETTKKGARIRYSTVDVTGLLQVTNPTIFLSQLESGFGRAKAFGCGLMLLRRA